MLFILCYCIIILVDLSRSVDLERCLLRALTEFACIPFNDIILQPSSPYTKRTQYELFIIRIIVIIITINIILLYLPVHGYASLKPTYRYVQFFLEVFTFPRKLVDGAGRRDPFSAVTSRPLRPSRTADVPAHVVKDPTAGRPAVSNSIRLAENCRALLVHGPDPDLPIVFCNYFSLLYCFIPPVW